LLTGAERLFRELAKQKNLDPELTNVLEKGALLLSKTL